MPLLEVGREDGFDEAVNETMRARGWRKRTSICDSGLVEVGRGTGWLDERREKDALGVDAILLAWSQGKRVGIPIL